jgi:hypothetical protein
MHPSHLGSASPVFFLQQPASSPSGAQSYLSWAAHVLASSPPFREAIAKLRAVARGETRGGYPLTTGPLTSYSFGTLEEMPIAWNGVWYEERPRAWSRNLSPTDEGLRHVRDYVRRCRTLARRYLVTETYGYLVHELVRADGYLLAVASIVSPYAAPTGLVASQVAACFTGASWGAGATANQQSKYRYFMRERTERAPRPEEE